MSKITVNGITIAALLVAVVGFIYTLLDDNLPAELSRYDCVDITLFALKDDRSAGDHCANYGGLAANGATGGEALVILVRNQPVGGSQGLERAIR